MTSVASQPTQTHTEPEPSKLSKDQTFSTTSTKFDIPKVPDELVDDDGKTVVGTDESPETESKFRSAVENLREAIEGYNNAIDSKADEKTIQKHEQNVVKALRETAESSPNPKVAEYYKAKALEFMRVGATAKKVLTNDIVKGALFILASPVALISSVIVSTGGLVYGLGSVVKGVGDLMSGMTFSGTVLGTKEKPGPKKKDAGVGNEDEEEGEGEGEGEKEGEEGQEQEDERAEGENAEAAEESQGDHAVKSTETAHADKAK